jgi:hypothetical protein
LYALQVNQLPLLLKFNCLELPMAHHTTMCFKLAIA